MYFLLCLQLCNYKKHRFALKANALRKKEKKPPHYFVQVYPTAF